MDEACALQPDEPRFELGELRVVATLDMVEEGHAPVR
jgi:hypothetical protein